jgi:hypothetical protein
MALSFKFVALLTVLAVSLGALAVVVLVDLLKNPSWHVGGFGTGLFCSSFVLLRKALSPAA